MLLRTDTVAKICIEDASPGALDAFAKMMEESPWAIWWIVRAERRGVCFVDGKAAAFAIEYLCQLGAKSEFNGHGAPRA